jgi:hypothetical protein
VTTVAGSGLIGWVDGPALSAAFGNPVGIAVHPVTGTLYVCDQANGAIRCIENGSMCACPLTAASFAVLIIQLLSVS